jgi:hypothetical protein
MFHQTLASKALSHMLIRGNTCCGIDLCFHPMFGHGPNEYVSDAVLRCGKIKEDAKQKAPAQFSLNRGLRLSANSLTSDETYQNPSGPLSAYLLDKSRR